MDEIGLYLTLATITGIMLYTQINKLTRKIDEEEAINPPKRRNFERANVRQDKNAQKYRDFADSIDEEIKRIKQDACEYDALRQDASEDKFLEELANISKKLVFIQTMNANATDEAKWESELVGILARIEDLLKRDFKDADLAVDRMRLNLEHKFKALND